MVKNVRHSSRHILGKAPILPCKQVMQPCASAGKNTRLWCSQERGALSCSARTDADRFQIVDSNKRFVQLDLALSPWQRPGLALNDGMQPLLAPSVAASVCPANHWVCVAEHSADGDVLQRIVQCLLYSLQPLSSCCCLVTRQATQPAPDCRLWHASVRNNLGQVSHTHFLCL
jgi:hypothetical protein